MIKKFSKKIHAFTLVELLLVIVIIGVISGLLIVSLLGAQKKGRDAKSKSNSASISKGLAQLKLDNNDAYYIPLATSSSPINIASTEFSNPSTGALHNYMKAGAFNVPTGIEAVYATNQVGSSYATFWELENITDQEVSSGSGVYIADLESNPGFVAATTTRSSALTFTAASFNKVTTPVDLGGTFQNYNNFTIAAWVNRTTLADLQMIMAKQFFNLSDLGSWRLTSSTGANNDEMECRFWANGGWRIAITTGNKFGVNEWAHWTCTWNGTIATIYKNGVSVATSLAVGNSNVTFTGSFNYPVVIGARGDGVTFQQWFNGKIDDVRVYTSLLSGADILALANRNYLSITAGRPLGEWLLDGTGTSAPSLPNLGTAGSGFNGTFTGLPTWVEGQNILNFLIPGSTTNTRAFVTYGPQ